MRRLITEFTPEELVNIRKDIRQSILLEEVNRPQCNGCGRVYVDFGKVKSKQMKFIESFTGHRFMSRPNHSYKSLYIGYDNASGTEYQRGLLIAKAFNNQNISAYVDGDFD